jgi:hypothetical protein
MTILIQFALRLSFGLALAMALTPPRLVTSGYYRNHSYVLLGLSVLAATLAWLHGGETPLWPPVTAAVLSYLSSVVWLYERSRLGIALLCMIAMVALYGAWLLPGGSAAAEGGGALTQWVAWLDPLAGGLVLGVTMAAMFLGHWYLNAPGMQLAPLRRLVVLMGGSLFLRAVVCGAGLMFLLGSGMPSQSDLLFIALRWLAGLIAAAGTVWMTWRILKIPNTQSATGVLYVAVIVTFIGELTAQLLAAKLNVPV